jgi:hypothetical protein
VSRVHTTSEIRIKPPQASQIRIGPCLQAYRIPRHFTRAFSRREAPQPAEKLDHACTTVEERRFSAA